MSHPDTETYREWFTLATGVPAQAHIELEQWHPTVVFSNGLREEILRVIREDALTWEAFEYCIPPHLHIDSVTFAARRSVRKLIADADDQRFVDMCLREFPYILNTMNTISQASQPEPEDADIAALESRRQLQVLAYTLDDITITRMLDVAFAKIHMTTTGKKKSATVALFGSDDEGA